MEKTKKKVLMLCTGGTIGMLHKDENDPSSPLVAAPFEKIKKHFPALDELSFCVEPYVMPLIDSSDMHPGYWIDIAKIIRDKYEEFSGFVILHGTDTMTYTATALSFLLENLNKPVIITGSQLPLAKPRNDAAQNMMTALILAASDGVPTVPEVCILFNNTLLRGNRSRKVSSSGFAGFNSPNFRPLAEIGEHIRIDTKLLRKATTKGFFINEVLNKNVMVFDIFPGISAEILSSVFAIKNLKGVVLRTYGTGNAPANDPSLLDQIENAIRKGIAVVNITQCVQGMVEMGLYDASMKLSRIGVISGVDMTPEAALVKMMFLLGQGYDDIETVKELMQRDLRGEQSYNAYNFLYDFGQTDAGVFRLKAQQLGAGFVKEKIVKASIRFDKVKILNDENSEKSLNLAVYMNYPSASVDAPMDIPQCLGIIKNAGPETDFVLECTQKVSQVIDPERPVQLTVISQNGDIAWRGVVLSIYTDVLN